MSAKNEAIDSYNVWIDELKQMVDIAEEKGVSRSWSEDFIIASLPAVFREDKHVQM